MAISTSSKQRYLRAQKQLQNRLMNKHLGPVFNSLALDLNKYSNYVYEHGIEQALNYAATPHINPTIGPVVSRLYEDAARMAYPQTRIMKGSVIPIFGFVRNVLQYFRDHLLSNVVVPISNTTRKHVEVALRDAITNGWGVDKTVREIKNTPLTRRHAKTIVRTESVRAMNYAQLLAADDDKYQVEKTWLAVEDGRTRVTHGHQGVDGEVRDLYDTFSNGLLHPGDPEGSAAEVINCRCTMAYTLKRTLNGRPVPKRPEDWAAADAFGARVNQ
jgi:hypothetical protein